MWTKIAQISVIIVIVFVSILFADFPQPNQTPETPTTRERDFNWAKRQLRAMYTPNRETFYCKCKFDASNRIDLTSCGYKIRSNILRAQRVEWEHIVPASYFGNNLACWKKGGREQCQKESNLFANFEGDMHNLVPEVGELNADRSNKLHGTVTSIYNDYGRCDFKISSIRAEPRDDIKGDVARIWLYMEYKYKIFLSSEMKTTFERWNILDPVSEEERWRNREIRRIQGDSNIFIQ